MNILRAVLVSLLLSVLAGCVETRFESTPGDNIETCDVHWKGLWSDPGSKDDPSAIYIDDECHFIALDQPERGGPLRRVRVPMNYVHAEGKDYIVVADTSLKGIVDVKPAYGIDPPPSKSYFIARYRLHGDTLEIYQVDTARVAKLIVDGKIEGTLSKTANELHAFVRGNRTKILEILNKQSIFEDKASTKLVHRKQTVDEFEQSIMHVPAKKP